MTQDPWIRHTEQFIIHSKSSNISTLVTEPQGPGRKATLNPYMQWVMPREGNLELREPESFMMGREHACTLLQREMLYFPRLPTLYTSLERQPRRKDSWYLCCKMCRNMRGSWRTVTQHHVSEKFFPRDFNKLIDTQGWAQRYTQRYPPALYMAYTR